MTAVRPLSLDTSEEELTLRPFSPRHREQECASTSTRTRKSSRFLLAVTARLKELRAGPRGNLVKHMRTNQKMIAEYAGYHRASSSSVARRLPSLDSQR